MDEYSGFDQVYTITDPAVGPQSDGTYQAPAAAQPNNTPWDTGGGTIGNYAGALDVLKYGIGAWSAVNQSQNMVDYRRYEATNGGVYAQGQAAGVNLGATVSSSSGLIFPLLVIAGLVLLLKN